MEDGDVEALLRRAAARDVAAATAAAGISWASAIRAAARDGDAAALRRCCAGGKRELGCLIFRDVASDLLLDAARGGHCEAIRILLVSGADVRFADSRAGGNEALHLAAMRGHARAAALLVSRGADLEARSRFGFTALCDAAHAGHCDVVRLLVKRGARLDAVNASGRSPEDEARNAGRAAAADLLRKLTREIPRMNLLELRILCERGRAETADPLLERLFPADPLVPAYACRATGVRAAFFLDAPGAAAMLALALRTALAGQPRARNVDVRALACDLENELKAVAEPPKRRRGACKARDGGRVPKEIFWHIIGYWRYVDPAIEVARRARVAVEKRAAALARGDVDVDFGGDVDSGDDLGAMDDGIW